MYHGAVHHFFILGNTELANTFKNVV